MAIVTKSATNEVALLPTNLDLKLYQGDSFDISFKLRASSGEGIDLTGWTGLVQFRDITNNIAATPTVMVNYEGELGVVRVFLEDTSNLPVGAYSYDLQMTDPSLRKRTYLAGTVTVTSDVSQ